MLLTARQPGRLQVILRKYHSHSSLCRCLAGIQVWAMTGGAMLYPAAVNIIITEIISPVISYHETKATEVQLRLILTIMNMMDMIIGSMEGKTEHHSRYTASVRQDGLMKIINPALPLIE